ncbi:MAG: class I adenylate cyclase [Thermodesulfobacteriota bacterium]
MTGPVSSLNEHELGAYVRRLLSNQKTFVLNNIMRIREMLRYAAPGFRKVFESVPFLLQVNRPQNPGYVESARPALGLYGFERSGFAGLYREAHPGKSFRDFQVVGPCIQSLTLIGSPGSVGHTQASDLDYWVCVNRDQLPPEGWTFLEAKLGRVAEWAAAVHDTEVHFYLLDLNDLRADRLGALAEEQSGDLMPRLLKEEFYRTLLHVAGRMPLWWVVSPEISQEEYEDISANLDRLGSTTFNPQDVVDLGFPQPAPPREYLGAAMWQTFKALKDPFKAVLKMVLLLEQVERGFRAPLPCHQIKETILNSRFEDLPVDPYLLTIRRVLDFVEDQPDIRDLVRISAWFKMSPPLEGPPSPERDPKTAILASLTRGWGWSEDRRRDLLGYQDWPERRKLAMGEEARALVFDLYSRLAARLRADYPEQVQVSGESLTRLNALILARFTADETRVEELPSAFHRQAFPRDLSLVHDGRRWLVYDSSRPQGDFLYQARRAARVAAWLVHNRVWGPGLKIRLRPGQTSLKLGALLALLPLLQKVLPPLSLAAVEEQGLLPRPVGTRVLIVNLEEPSDQKRLATAELIFRTNIGQTGHEVLELDLALSEAEKLAWLARKVLDTERAAPEDVQVFVPPGEAQAELEHNLELALRRQARRDRQAPGSRLRLDLD